MNSSTPVDVTGLGGGVASISTGGFHTCAVTLTGGAACWGDNYFHQLGDGTATDRSTPVSVVGLSSGVSEISSGSLHTCALMVGGSGKCWGHNNHGQLGSGSGSAFSSTPVDVIQTSGLTTMNAGFAHNCAVAHGGAKCWGYNFHGKIGNGGPNDSNTPRSVSELEPADTDLDGCGDDREGQTTVGSELTGGRRDSKDAWDYFNPSHDLENRVDDILLVLNQYYLDDDDANPGEPPYVAGYDADTDRTLAGPNAWELGPPNGQQRVDDILNMVKQYFHDCS
jgi:hypothetical protein